MKKINSALELAKYRIGDTVWYIIITDSNDFNILNDDDHWMINYHPKIMWTRGPLKGTWPKNKKLPRLPHHDFFTVMSTIGSEFIVCEFVICDVNRSLDTGEYFYASDEDEWIPENELFATRNDAKRERTRILKLIREWANAEIEK